MSSFRLQKSSSRLVRSVVLCNVPGLLFAGSTEAATGGRSTTGSGD
jgi:hypothetical protein